MQRNIGIIFDGSTDYEIISKLVEVILTDDISAPSELNFIKLRQSLRDSIDTYWRKTTTSKEYYLPKSPAKDLQSDIITNLKSALGDFRKLTPDGYCSSYDLIIISSDSEKRLVTPRNYFDVWNFTLNKIILGSIEKFYDIQSGFGNGYQFLPLILPLIIFPSTDILIAAAKTSVDGKIKFHNKKPSDLKQGLYGTTKLWELSEGEFEEKALAYLTIDGINAIYKHIPEIRFFFQSLSWGRIENN